MDPSNRSPLLLDVLPGEIRNHVYDICIRDAMSRAKRRSQKNIFGTTRFSPPNSEGFTVTVLPQWNGNGSLRFEGIGSLPLLFVNKQIFDEVSSLLHSKVEEVTIGPYGIQYSNEDANIRWAYAYALLRRHPYLLKHTKNISVYLPWLRRDQMKKYWSALGYRWTKPDNRCYAWGVIPELAVFLKSFESLSTLKVTVVAEVRKPPKMDALLPLWDICGHQTKVEIVEPYFQGDVLQAATPQLSEWVGAWHNCHNDHVLQIATLKSMEIAD